MALSHFFAVFAACIVLATPSAQANETQEINLQYRKGDLNGALTRANAQLAKNPKDAQVRFLKGLILADQGKTNEAIAVFTSLTEDYPELPEPYNNLAVLYASQNKYEAAKNALESAIRTHPSYATAHENLGDIYAKMASIAYDKALALDSKNAAAQTKLALIQEMIGEQPRKPAASKPAAAKPAAKPVATEAAAKPTAKPAAEPTSKPVAAEASPTKPAVAGNPEIEAALTRWAQAWSARDVDAYLAAYSPDFTADGMTRADWEAQRRTRITAPKTIEVKLSDLKIEQQGTTASATFRQAYRSDRLSSTTNKTLKLALQNGQWRIVGETSR
jgi:tetratricopeptide (TPR) repeat protein